jgi:signal transduction histidine kinase
MNRLNFKRVGILIGLTLVFAIGMQAWRMVGQFTLIQSQLQSDIQESLDNAVESYYAELAKTDVIALTDISGENGFLRDDSIPERSITHITIDQKNSSDEFFDEILGNKKLFQTIEKAGQEDFSSAFWKEIQSDSSHEMVILDSNRRMAIDKKNDLQIFFGKDQADSINQLKFLTSKIIISITRDSLDFDKINALLFQELDRRGIDIDYKLIHTKGLDPFDSLSSEGTDKMPFQVISRSTFLPRDQKLALSFENTALTILKRGTAELLISLLFLGIVAYAFYYLYQTIKNQKEIAEIKQDLIANITHEFKTPIATTLSAIEGIQQFNPENDPSKTNRYLGISKNQMLKLNQMVEKLLETATLDSDQLVLKKEQIEPESLLTQLIQKFQTLAPEKSIDLILPANPKPIFADSFHFENVLSNLLDNAIKYGGDQIRISLDQNGMHKIRIYDNGGNISPEQKERVFEQFYRIPKGDLHDVKGFGIGLYYVKKILEKHEGRIELETGKNSTTFITYWP